MLAYLFLFIGGGVGSILRYLLSSYNGDNVFFWGTLLANVLSTFLLGIFAALKNNDFLSGTSYLLLAVGFCGGFSTFSTFSMELVHLLKEKLVIQAILYLSVSVISGIVAFLAGYFIINH